MSERSLEQGEYAFFDYKPDMGDRAREVLDGLAGNPKQVSPKYFYDERGSALFEQITQLDEYYLTRTEMSLFDAHLPAIAEQLGDGLALIEYGSGSSAKIRKVLTSVTPTAYVPVDISQVHLQANARALHADFPQLHVYPICADITQPFALPDAIDGLTRVGFFPGSSIGNFDPAQARAFLRNVRETVGEGGALLIGVDRKKSISALEAAYNDPGGVTAAFNLNLLHHINATLDGNFDVSAFEHDARYNEALGCIQMFLRATRAQTVSVAGTTVAFAAGETLHTENSYKYHPDEFLALAEGAGFRDQAYWSDAQSRFALFLLRGA